MTSNTYTITDPWVNTALGVPQGWECPRCRRVNAPTMSQCTCRPEYGLERGPVWHLPYQSQPQITCTVLHANGEQCDMTPATSYASLRDLPDAAEG